MNSADSEKTGTYHGCTFPRVIDKTTLAPMFFHHALGSPVGERKLDENWQRLTDAVPLPTRSGKDMADDESLILADYDDAAYCQMAVLRRLHVEGRSSQMFELEVEAVASPLNSNDYKFCGPWEGVIREI